MHSSSSLSPYSLRLSSPPSLVSFCSTELKRKKLFADLKKTPQKMSWTQILDTKEVGGPDRYEGGSNSIRMNATDSSCFFLILPKLSFIH